MWRITILAQNSEKEAYYALYIRRETQLKYSQNIKLHKTLTLVYRVSPKTLDFRYFEIRKFSIY